MPNRIETPELSEGDQTWIASTRDIRHNRTVKLNKASFTIDPTLGYLPSGTPLALVDSDDEGLEAVPYDQAEATVTGAGVLAGFLFTDQRWVEGATDEYVNAPLVDGAIRIRVSRLPIAFTVPAAEAKLAATNFIYDVS